MTGASLGLSLNDSITAARAETESTEIISLINYQRRSLSDLAFSNANDSHIRLQVFRTRDQAEQQLYVMDLSVLEGKDPAGYRAEQKLREVKQRIENPFAKASSRAKNPGNAFVTDVIQRNSYRRNRQRDLDKLNFEVKKKRREDAKERFQSTRESINKELEERTAKRRAKRQAKKAKRGLKQGDVLDHDRDVPDNNE